MKKYAKITLDGSQVNHSTVRGIKLAIRKGKLKEGKYKCTCPSGNVHIWNITVTPFVSKNKKTFTNVKAIFEKQ